MAFTAMLPLAGLAQSASQITSHNFRPDWEGGSPPNLRGTSDLSAPSGAQNYFIKLTGLDVTNGLPALAQATAGLERRLTAREVSGAVLFAAAHDLEAAYAKAGYVLVRVILPPQKLVDGARLKLIVIDGIIERVDTGAVPEPVRGRVGSLMAPLANRHGVLLQDIERQLLLAGDIPGLTLRSALAPGGGQGASILVVNGTYQSVTETVRYDNTLSAALLRTTLSAESDFNSIAGFGELAYIRVSGHPNGGSGSFFLDDPVNRSLAEGFVIPAGLDGLSFNFEAAQTWTAPVPTGGVKVTDRFERFSLRLRYAWLRSRLADFASEIAFDAESETEHQLMTNSAEPLWADRLRIFRWINEGDLMTPWGAQLSGHTAASFGFDGLGARPEAAAATLPLSRQNANDVFQKFEVTLTYQQNFDEHLSMNVSAKGQTSFNQIMLRSEQIGIANSSGLSAFDSGSINGDQGYVTRGELSSPWSVPVPGGAAIAAPYLFVAYGGVFLQDPTALESGSIRALSYGSGMRLAGGYTALMRANGTLDVEFGHAARSDNIPSGNRLTFISSLRF